MTRDRMAATRGRLAPVVWCRRSACVQCCGMDGRCTQCWALHEWCSDDVRRARARAGECAGCGLSRSRGGAEVMRPQWGSSGPVAFAYDWLRQPAL